MSPRPITARKQIRIREACYRLAQLDEQRQEETNGRSLIEARDAFAEAVVFHLLNAKKLHIRKRVYIINEFTGETGLTHYRVFHYPDTQETNRKTLVELANIF